MFTISFLKPEDLKGMCSLHSFDDPSWLERGSRGKGIFADNSVRLSEEEEGSSVGKCLASQLARGKALTDDQPGRFCVRLPNFHTGNWNYWLYHLSDFQQKLWRLLFWLSYFNNVTMNMMVMILLSHEYSNCK